MVHALNEAWRVLVPQGILIDVRPLSVDVSLEVVDEEGNVPVGMVDLSPDLEYDIAADQAIDSVVHQGFFAQDSLEVFDYAYHWLSYHAMVADFEARWKDEMNVSTEVLEKARLIYQQKRPKARLRLPMRMKLGKYTKQALSG